MSTACPSMLAFPPVPMGIVPFDQRAVSGEPGWSLPQAFTEPERYLFSMARSGCQNDSYLDEWKRLMEPDLEAIAFNGQSCDPTKVDPKVLEWVKQHCAKTPHFIKVVVPGAVAHSPSRDTCKLVVPGPFAQQHFRKLERVVKLEDKDAGKTWKVSFGRPTRNPSWQQGWRRCARDNHLKSGDVLVFVLVGDSHFHFTHFDEDGNPINSIAGNRNQRNTLGDSDQSQADAVPSLTKRMKPTDEQEAQSSDQPVGVHPHSNVAPAHSGQSDEQIEETPAGSVKRKRLCKVGEKAEGRIRP